MWNARWFKRWNEWQIQYKQKDEKKGRAVAWISKEMQLLWDNRDGRGTQHGEIVGGNMELGSTEVCKTRASDIY